MGGGETIKNHQNAPKSTKKAPEATKNQEKLSNSIKKHQKTSKTQYKTHSKKAKRSTIFFQKRSYHASARAWTRLC